MVALDLASKIDFAVMAMLFEEIVDGERHYTAFVNHYLPEEAIEGEDKSQLQGWAKEGWITLTPGPITDYEYIIDDIREIKSQYEIIEVPYDPFQATQLATQLLGEGFPMVEYGATVKNFSEPMKEFEAAVIDGRFHHNGDPVLTWMISNVVGHYDKKDNIFPNKEIYANKIDGAVALVMCFGRLMAPKEDNMITQGFVRL